MDHVRVIGDPPRRSNAQLMVDCHRLGLLDGWVHDATYGQGRWWKQIRPGSMFTCSDLDPACGVPIMDFTALAFSDRSVDTIILDPPYKLNGTPTGRGPATSDDSYGVGGGYTTVAARHDLMTRGLVEASRVARRWVLFKCQDQVVSGNVQWQTRLFADVGEHPRCGMRLWNRMHVYGYRKQPRRTQVHPHTDYSTLLIFKVPS